MGSEPKEWVTGIARLCRCLLHELPWLWLINFLYFCLVDWVRIKGARTLTVDQGPRITICDSNLVIATRTCHHFKKLWGPVLIRIAAWHSFLPPHTFSSVEAAVEGFVSSRCCFGSRKVVGGARTPCSLKWWWCSWDSRRKPSHFVWL